MIIFFEGKNNKLKEDIKSKLKNFVNFSYVFLRERSIFILTNEISENLLYEIKKLSDEIQIISLKRKYKLSNSGLFSNKSIKFGKVSIDKEHFTVIAGPCTVEDDGSLDTIAKYLKGNGVNFLRGGAFKPRTSPYDFQGLGKRGLMLLKRAAQNNGLFTVSELMDIRDLEYFEKYVDIIQIGARNMQNYSMLKELGKINKPVFLKRGMSASINEFLLAADYILSGGNEKVILCERGIKSFETKYRAVLDLTAVAFLKTETHLPVFVDPSHAAGNRELVPDLSLAAMAVGADGLIIEVHSEPDCAVCDGKQSLTLEQTNNLLHKLKRAENIFGKKIN